MELGIRLSLVKTSEFQGGGGVNPQPLSRYATDILYGTNFVIRVLFYVRSALWNRKPGRLTILYTSYNVNGPGYLTSSEKNRLPLYMGPMFNSTYDVVGM
jgi:hypothetical protein